METYFYEAFEQMERLGPGSDESTKRAMEFFPNPDAQLRILDIGCGVGAHSFQLATYFPNAIITAIDNHAPNIDRLNQTAKQRGVSNRIYAICMSMFEMTFADASFDLIWAEGSIYIAGFEKGIQDWKRLLKIGGYIICSEISWLLDTPSDESYHFWHKAYPEMDTITNNLRKIEAAGYAIKGNFVSPSTDWTTHYYDLMENNLQCMREKYVDHVEAMQVVEMLQTEMDVYHSNMQDYSYVFYAMERV
ncbi:class I SAM-dependent methyltransferase [Paenibacillus terrigena]|uniref:class I SAM-dependent methyltransferase n=1 Tax=Paenibacillus terrigena TaxID=369333 RepID=UPI0028D79944|nr:class I SAM-dependent methyltransferase [Paenibacillus terrigena]